MNAQTSTSIAAFFLVFNFAYGQNIGSKGVDGGSNKYQSNAQQNVNADRGQLDLRFAFDACKKYWEQAAVVYASKNANDPKNHLTPQGLFEVEVGYNARANFSGVNWVNSIELAHKNARNGKNSWLSSQFEGTLCSLQEIYKRIHGTYYPLGNEVVKREPDGWQERESVSPRPPSQQPQAARQTILSDYVRANREAVAEAQKFLKTRPDLIANGCITLESTRSVLYIQNNCPQRVSVTFCYENPKADTWASAYDCSKPTGLKGAWPSGGKKEGANPHFGTVHWFACKEPGLASNVRWNGKGLEGGCR